MTITSRNKKNKNKILKLTVKWNYRETKFKFLMLFLINRELNIYFVTIINVLIGFNSNYKV